MRIFLTGFMGAGKTTVGRLLAARLERPFADLDEVVEAEVGRSIPEIFERGGEPLFRRLEAAALRRVIDASPALVLATGGGTVTVEANLELLLERGLLLWLHPDFATIASRIGALGKDDRPLFADETQALDLLRRRLPAYRRSHLEIAVGPEESPEEVAHRAALAIEARA